MIARVEREREDSFIDPKEGNSLILHWLLHTNTGSAQGHLGSALETSRPIFHFCMYESETSHTYLQVYKKWKANESSGDLKTDLRTSQHLHLLQLFYVLHFWGSKRQIGYFFPCFPFYLFWFCMKFGPEVLWWLTCWVPPGRPHPNTDNFIKRRKPADLGNCYRMAEHGASKSCQSCDDGSLDDCWEDFLAKHSKASQPVATTAMLHQNDQLSRNCGAS